MMRGGGLRSQGRGHHVGFGGFSSGGFGSWKRWLSQGTFNEILRISILVEEPVPVCAFSVCAGLQTTAMCGNSAEKSLSTIVLVAS